MGQEFEVRGESWWKKSDGHVSVQVFAGYAKTPFQSAEDVVLAGFENWWELGVRGVAKPLVADRTLRDWNRWISMPKEKATAKILEFKKDWADRIEISSNYYQEVVSRRIATVEGREKRAEQRTARQVRERNEMRKMFRNRYDNP